MRGQKIGAIGLFLCLVVSMFLGSSILADTPPVLVNASANTTVTGSWDCNGVGLSASAVIPDQTAAVVFGVPNPAPAGTKFNVTVDVATLNLSAAPAFLDLNSAGVTATATVTGGTLAAAIPVTNFVGNGASLNLNPFTVEVNQPAGSRTVSVSKLTIVVGATGFVCDAIGNPPSVTFTVGTPTTTTTTTTTSVPPTTTVPTTTTTSVPPSTTVPPGPVKIVEATRTVNYGCQLIDPATGGPFGSGQVPDSTVTFVVRYPDKVGAGQTFQIQVRLQPAPKNGPIKLSVGEVAYTIVLRTNGSTGSEVVLTGTNTVGIEPNETFTLPQDDSFLVGEVTAPATAGGTISMDLGKVDLLGDKGVKVLTSCSPEPLAGESSTKVASLVVVEEQIDVPVVTTTTTTVPSSGFANCAAAKAAGRGVIPRSSPAYSRALDSDGDGLACEASEGQRASVAGITQSRTPTAASLAFSGARVILPVGVGLALTAVGAALLGLLARRPRRGSGRP